MVKILRKQFQSMPSKEVDNPNFKRVYYIRYADDWLVGVCASKQEVAVIKERVK